MRIMSSDVNMSATHSLIEKDVKQQSMQFWIGNRGGRSLSITSNLAESMHKEIVEISEQGRQQLKAKLRELEKNQNAEEQLDTAQTDPKVLVLEKLLSALTGKTIKINVPDLEKIQNNSEESQAKMTALQDQQGGAGQGVGWGFRFDSYEAHIEQEATSFTAGGSVTTADGRKINFALDLTMTRQYIEENRISIRAGDALKDPLVINFSAPAAALTEQKYDFDIDSDGAADKISFVGPGSGFLALDTNDDGKINDGSELFGTQSGNGFADLARYDEDGNNWIDENDAVFAKLRLWTKDENGVDQLISLKDANIGAIYLDNVSTAFSLKDSDNQLLGQLKTTGLFLRENGPAGTVQQVDIAV